MVVIAPVVIPKTCHNTTNRTPLTHIIPTTTPNTPIYNNNNNRSGGVVIAAKVEVVVLVVVSGAIGFSAGDGERLK